jgi:hypothetical protein
VGTPVAVALYGVIRCTGGHGPAEKRAFRHEQARREAGKSQADPQSAYAEGDATTAVLKQASQVAFQLVQGIAQHIQQPSAGQNEIGSQATDPDAQHIQHRGAFTQPPAE